MGAVAAAFEGEGVALSGDAAGEPAGEGWGVAVNAGEAFGVWIGAGCPALESVTPGASSGPQKASPSPAAGPTVAGSSAGTGDAVGPGVATAWVPNSIVTLEASVWPPAFWIAALGIVTW